MNVLVVGNGAREHAIAWKFSQSSSVGRLYVAPGNAGTHFIATNVPIGAEDIAALIDFASNNAIDLTVVGPEAPLAAGIVDSFTASGLPVFGPTQAAARIEGSKSFAKTLMADCSIPTAASETFTDFERASAYLDTCPIPIVVKADGLAAGKGVTVAQTREQAQDAVRESMLGRAFGDAGDRVLIEECLEGQEVSVFAFVDGEYVSPMIAACDYKRVGDGDTGPNTGGMGSYSPPPFWDDELARKVRAEIMEPVSARMAEIGCPFQGFLYAGLMITKEGPKVIEFNCRMGDPEAQVVIPRLKSDLLELALCTAEGNLSEQKVEWSDDSWVGVVLASDGYPGGYETGFEVSGLPEDSEECVVFHAGTKLCEILETNQNAKIVTSGGRVMTVASRGDTISDARLCAYRNADGIEFGNVYFRRDIATGI